MALLKELLTPEEFSHLHEQKKEVNVDTDIRELKVKELSDIAFILLNNKQGVMSSLCIEELTERAIEKNISIY
jgi:ribosomal protein L16 Arg81 hydroxylase